MSRPEFESECIHEMTRQFCTFCKKKSPTNHSSPLPDHDTIRRPFTDAQFPGECPDCSSPIEAGDLIGKRLEKWVCTPCAEQYDLEESKSLHPSRGGSRSKWYWT